MVAIRRMEEDLSVQMLIAGSASDVGSNMSTMSVRKNLTRKIRNKQKIIMAKGSAIRNALQVKGKDNNPRAIAKAGVVWATIEHTRVSEPVR